MIYIGIDPGKDGAMTVIQARAKIEYIDIYPYNEDDYIKVLHQYNPERVRCVLEKVNAMPGQGVTSMFNFGQNFGFIQGVLKAYSIPYELVPPQKWKKEFSVTSDKNTSIEVAKRLFPHVNLKRTERCKKDHDGMAEALLLACYAKRHML